MGHQRVPPPGDKWLCHTAAYAKAFVGTIYILSVPGAPAINGGSRVDSWDWQGSPDLVEIAEIFSVKSLI